MKIIKLNIGTKFYHFGKNFGEHVPLTTEALGAGLRNSEVSFIVIIDIYLENDIIQIKHTIDGEEHVLTLTQFKNIYDIYEDKPNEIVDVDLHNINDRLTNLENKVNAEIKSIDNVLAKMSTDLYKHDDFHNAIVKIFNIFLKKYKGANNE